MAGKKWTDEEIEFVKVNFGKIETDEIAAKIGKTRKAVWHKLDALGLRRDDFEIGDKRNFLTLISDTYLKKDNFQKKRYGIFRCDCGKEKEYRVTAIKKGKTISCGCQKGAKGEDNAAFKHGWCGARLHRIWTAMKTRCDNTNVKCFKDYGGRGIKICEEWYDFVNFRDWALANGYSDNLSIDRINVNGNYEPTNCRWSTYKEQARNKTNNILITAFNKSMTLPEWIESGICPNISYEAFNYRISNDWTVEEALTTPSQFKNRDISNLTEMEISDMLYNRWKSMRHRCYDEKSIRWKNYGGRGIRICDAWKYSFDTFFKWAIENGFQPQLSLDRIDVDGNYSPENCKWSNALEQANNKSCL